MIDEKNINLEKIISDIFKETRIKISEDDPVLATVFIYEKILESILLKIRESNVLITDSLRDKLSSDLLLINSEISKLPDSIDSKTEELRNAAVALHDEFQQSKGEVKGSIEEASNNATKRLHDAVSDASDAAKKVVDAANKSVTEINTHAENLINSTLKKSLVNYDEKTTDITKKLDNAIRNAFEKSTKKIMTICGIALFFSTVLQLGMWGWFVWRLSH
ncbi:hypothetical protein V7L32_004286 [Salmonella enterica]